MLWFSRRTDQDTTRVALIIWLGDLAMDVELEAFFFYSSVCTCWRELSGKPAMHLRDFLVLARILSVSLSGLKGNVSHPP